MESIRRPALPAVTFGRVIAGAVVLALVGTGTAYAANEWTGENIVNESLTSVDIKNHSLTTADIKNNNLTTNDIRDGSLTAPDVGSDALTGATIDESTLDKVPNADQLDGVDSADFSRIFAMESRSDSMLMNLAFGDNFGFMASLTPALSGRCTVTGTMQIFSSSPSTTRGPFFRLAVKRGESPPETDYRYGHHVSGKPHGYSESMSRTSTFAVVAGQPVQFGIFLGGTPSTYVGDYVSGDMSYLCTTLGVGVAFAPEASQQEKKAAEAQDAGETTPKP